MAVATTSRQYTGRRPAAPARKFGTWKLAYADFLTALMAFFLLLWLVSGVSQDGRAQIASYFNDKPIAQTGQPVSATDPVSAGVLADLKSDSVLKAAGRSVVLVTTPDGVRLNLVDSARNPLFDTGSGELTDAGRTLVQAAGHALTTLPYTITIEGHTDAFPSADPARTNWDISAQRASEARRALMAAGINEDRVRAVTGLADTQPLRPGQPHLSENRRISILVHTIG